MCVSLCGVKATITTRWRSGRRGRGGEGGEGGEGIREKALAKRGNVLPETFPADICFDSPMSPSFAT